MASVLIRPPYILIWLNRCWGQGGCPLGSHPPSGCVGRRLKWLLWGNPPSLSQKGDLLAIHIRISISHRISPRCLWWVLGGAFSSQSAIFLWKSSISCCNSLSMRSPRFAWRCCGVLPPRWGLLGDKLGSSSPSECGG